MSVRSVIGKLRKTELAWRYGSNFSPTIKYMLGGNSRLSTFEEGILKTLNSDGIAFTSVDEILGFDSAFQEVDLETRDILRRREAEIAELKSLANDASIGNKTFNLEVLGSELTCDVGSGITRVALNDTLLSIANGYFGMYAKLRYYNVWYTFASQGQARESQLWHFDREDNYILKVFLYLDDVDEGAGPFTYAPGTHKKGKYRSIKPDHFLEGGVRRTTDDQMKAVFPEEKWVRGVGKKGTIIFADTRGYHKGGEARTADRLMFTCMYTSPASESRNLIRFPNDINLGALSDGQVAALYIR
jgi:hypothetical protein